MAVYLLGYDSLIYGSFSGENTKPEFDVMATRTILYSYNLRTFSALVFIDSRECLTRIDCIRYLARVWSVVRVSAWEQHSQRRESDARSNPYLS